MPQAQIIRHGSVRVRLFINRSGPVVRHEIRWTDQHGRPRRRKRTHRPEAILEARRIAKDIAQGRTGADLSLSDLASFRGAIQNLYGTGKTLELATAEYAECRRILLNDSTIQRFNDSTLPSLPDLARHWLKSDHASRNPEPVPLTTAIEQFLLTKSQEGVSPRWLATLRSQLTRFTADMQSLAPIEGRRASRPLDIQCLTPSTIQSWFLTLPKASARTRNNHLAAVQSLFASPALRQHPERTAILDLKPAAALPAHNDIWTPAEFSRLLHTAVSLSEGEGRGAGVGFQHLLPILVLGGFAKVRSSEIMRLDWSALRLNESRLLLRAGQTKTRRLRIVPLPPAAVAWLRLSQHSLATGGEGRGEGAPLWPWGTQKFNADLRRLAETCGLKWRKNALRNSAVTYDQILNPDLARVAREAGNSPKILETEYLALDGITKATARAWFALRPPKATTNILKLA